VIAKNITNVTFVRFVKNFGVNFFDGVGILDGGWFLDGIKRRDY